ncbi:hypothetical protein L6452_06831 [Arctium lappa]|uniref:Uncharacterized protein n=1 Tax=Arctium lappa TaxID=4217 RepID=A0ACB9EL74_ARCLA|nr:hypothetical protein L6452_06831 [Arctium lappa]
MKKIHELALSSKKVNVSEITKNVMQAIVMRVGFGKSYEDGHEWKRVSRLIGQLQATITTFFISDLWPGLPFVGLIDKLMGKMDLLEKCFRDLDSFYQELIDEHLDPQNSKPHEEDQDIIDILIQLKKDQSFELTSDHLKAILAVTTM